MEKQTKTTYHEEGVLDGCLVHDGAEEVFTERQDHELLKEAVAEHELLGGTRDVAVVVEDTHACVTRDLHLESDVLAEVDALDLGLLGSVGTVGGHASAPEGLEALVSNLINHFIDNANY